MQKRISLLIIGIFIYNYIPALTGGAISILMDFPVAGKRLSQLASVIET
jgi:hypothetical protein